VPIQIQKYSRTKASSHPSRPKRINKKSFQNASAERLQSHFVVTGTCATNAIDTGQEKGDEVLREDKKSFRADSEGAQGFSELVKNNTILSSHKTI